MSKFQVINVKPFSGTSKTGNPYAMLICSGIHTDDDGSCEVGEVTFMQGRDRPLPSNIRPGEVYSPVVGAVVRDGKMTFQILSLKEIAFVSALKEVNSK